MTNHIDIHTDTPLIPAVNVHTDTLQIPPDIAHGDAHVDTPKVRHQDIHADIDVNEKVTHKDHPSIPAILVHTDEGAHLDSPPLLHGDESNFHIDASDRHTDIPHSDNHGDGLQFTTNGIHGDVHYDAVDHTDGVAHTDYIALLNSRRNYHEDVPRITFHVDSSFRADESFETKLDEEDK